MAESPVELASLAGNTLVAATVTDEWENAHRRVARLLGRGDPGRTKLVKQRLDATRRQLTAAVSAADLQQVQAALAAQWATRLGDLLDEDPGTEADLRSLVREIQALLPAHVVSTASHSIAAGRDVNITASGGGIAVGVIERLDYHPPEVARQPVSLPPRPVYLAGREDLLGELDALLTSGDGVGPRIAVLRGLGGVGKTSVAMEYAHRHRAEVGVAWRLAAENPAALEAGFAELAAQLGARDLFDTRSPVVSVHTVLAAYPAEWLLVFDNAPDPESVWAFLPPAGHGRVLVTTQGSLWPPRQVLDVPVLDTEVAAGFLADRTGDLDGQSARQLAVELGGLPLALEQAAAYIYTVGGSLARYLGRFQQRRADLLARGPAPGYGKTVATTWALAFERLQQSAPSAVGLLRLMACCGPEVVPLPLLLQPRPGLAGRLGAEVAPVLMPLLNDSLAGDDAIVALRQYSLVTPAADGALSVHRLVQAVTADQMPPELADQWHQAAAALIEAAIPADTDPPETWPACAVLLPHAQVALSADSDGMERIVNYLGERGSYGAARDLQASILAARKQVLGAEHPRTLAAWHNLAYWTGRAGDPAGTRDQFAALLEVRERVFGADHPHTLTTRSNLARWTGAAGDPASARDQFAALLLVRERVLGADHPDTLISRASLAMWTGRAGDPASARDQLSALLAVCEQALGAEHRRTLATRDSLARWTGQAGDPASARDQFAALLPIRERLLGTDHPLALTAQYELARWTGEAGDPASARDRFAALLPVSTRVLTAEHRQTLAAQGQLARWTGEAGDPASARDRFAALLPVCLRVLGAEHPHTLEAQGNLARWTGEAGDLASMHNQFATLLPVFERVLGAEHRQTLTARAYLGRPIGKPDPGEI